MSNRFVCEPIKDVITAIPNRFLVKKFEEFRCKISYLSFDLYMCKTLEISITLAFGLHKIGPLMEILSKSYFTLAI